MQQTPPESSSTPAHGAPGHAKRGPRVLAIASEGGHWVQLRRLAPAFEGCEVIYASTNPGYRHELAPGERLVVVPDANRWQKLRVLWMALRVVLMVAWLRPRAVVTTGAAPGYIAVRAARLLGARTMWLDSIANGEELSMSGAMASRHVDVCLTQWPDLADGDRVLHRGSVL